MADLGLSSSLFSEFALDESQTVTVQEILAQMVAIRDFTQSLVDNLAELGDISPEDIVTLLAARDAAVAAQAAAEDAASSIGSVADDVFDARDSAAGASAAAVSSAAQSAIDAATVAASLSTASLAASSAASAAALASQRAIEADKAANAPEDEQITPGRYSTNHYLRKAETATQAGSAFTVVNLKTGDDLLTGNTYTLRLSDLFKTLVFELTADTNVILPANLWSTLNALGEPTEAWIRLRLHIDSTHDLILVEDGTAAVLDVTELYTNVFTYAAEPAVTDYVGSHSITIPAGVGRYVAFLAHTTFATTKSPRVSALTVSDSEAVTKAAGDTSTSNFSSGGAVDTAIWVAELADSLVPTTHTVAYTGDDNPLAYVLGVLGVGNSSGHELAAAATLPTAANTQSVDVDPTDERSRIAYLLSHVGSDALPLTPTVPAGTTVHYNTKTGLSRALKDLAFTFGTQLVAVGDAASRTYAQASAKSVKGGRTSIVFKPDIAIVPTVTLVAADGATVTTPGKSIVITAASDGQTYYRE